MVGTAMMLTCLMAICAGIGTVRPEVHLRPLTRSFAKRTACTASWSVAVEGMVVMTRGKESLLAATRRFFKKRWSPHMVVAMTATTMQGIAMLPTSWKGSLGEMLMDGPAVELDDMR